MTTFETITISIAICSMVISAYGIKSAVAAKRSAVAAEEQAKAALEQAKVGKEQLEIANAQHRQQRRVALGHAQRALADRVQIAREIPTMLARVRPGDPADYIGHHPLQIDVPAKSAYIEALLDTDALRKQWHEICDIETRATFYLAKKQMPKVVLPAGLIIAASDDECRSLAQEAADKLHAFQQVLAAAN